MKIKPLDGWSLINLQNTGTQIDEKSLRRILNTLVEANNALQDRIEALEKYIEKVDSIPFLEEIVNLPEGWEDIIKRNKLSPDPNFSAGGGFTDGGCVTHEFKSKPQPSKQHKKYLQALATLRDTSSFEPDWENENQNKFYIFYDYLEKKFNPDCCWSGRLRDEIYYETEEAAQSVIDNYKEELETCFKINQ